MKLENGITAVGICIYKQYTDYMLLDDRSKPRFTRVLINPGGNITPQTIEWQISCALADLRKEGYQPRILCVSIDNQLLQQCMEIDVVYSKHDYLYFHLQTRLSCTSLALGHSESMLFAHDTADMHSLRKEAGGVLLECMYYKDMKILSYGAARYAISVENQTMQ